jgi:ATP-dependent 26S proteasome regulatory subunit
LILSREQIQKNLVCAIMRELLGIHQPSTLFAYLDGGTGSMMLQAALAGLLSAAFIAKARWAQFRSFLARARREDHIAR